MAIELTRKRVAKDRIRAFCFAVGGGCPLAYSLLKEVAVDHRDSEGRVSKRSAKVLRPLSVITWRRRRLFRATVWVSLYAGNLLLAELLSVRALDANIVMQRSVAALQLDWEVAPQYNYFKRDVEPHGTKTFQVVMILGSSYRRLMAINGARLSPQRQKEEQRKLDQALAQRRGESRERTEERVANYKKDRRRDHRLIEELTKAFIFKLSGEATVNSHQVYVLDATALPGYRPRDKETEVLTGMRGRLWIDQATFQWVKVEAEVIRPVSIEGFVATVEPGTRFELEKAPVPGGAWLPAHFSMRSRAKILLFIGHNSHADESYFNYQRAGEQGATPTEGEVERKEANMTAGEVDSRRVRAVRHGNEESISIPTSDSSQIRPL